MKTILISLIFNAAAISVAPAGITQPASTAAKVPVPGIVSAFNSRGIIHYCSEKAILSREDADEALKPDRWPVLARLDPNVQELARQAEAVGMRGVMFTFAAAQGGVTAPAVTLEDLVASDHTTSQSLCQTLAVSGAENPEPVE